MIATCKHIHDSGSLCGSPALSGSKHCYFHSRLRQKPTKSDDGSIDLIITGLDSIEGIQLAVSNVLHALNDGLIDTHKANALYRGLALALSALRLKLTQQKHASKSSDQNSSDPLSSLLSLLPANTAVSPEGTTSNSPARQAGMPASNSPRPIGTPEKFPAALCRADTPVRHADATTAAQSTTNLSTPKSDNPETPSDNNGPMTPSPDVPILSPKRLKQLRSIIRKGPSHPLFHTSARILDAHIVRTANARIQAQECGADTPVRGL